MEKYNTEYKDYSNHITIMISTDRSIFIENSAVMVRMTEQAKQYKELHIIIFTTKKFETIKIAPNCTLYATNSFVRWNYIINAIKIGKKIIKNIDKNDKVLVTCQDPFETGLVGKVLANLRKNSELLLQIHTDLFSPYFTKYSFLNRIRLFISRFTLPHADVVRVVSRKIADDILKRGFKAEEIVLKPISVNVEAIRNGVPSFSLRDKFPQYKKIILMVSRLEKEKNIDMAIEALALMQNRDIGLVVLGSGKELQKLKKLADKLKLEDRVAFVGWQTDLVSYYKGCDIFLNTSWYEGYGMTLVEAQAAGCRIVSTDVGVAREVGVEIVGWERKEIASKILDLFGLV